MVFVIRRENDSKDLTKLINENQYQNRALTFACIIQCRPISPAITPDFRLAARIVDKAIPGVTDIGERGTHCGIVEGVVKDMTVYEGKWVWHPTVLG